MIPKLLTVPASAKALGRCNAFIYSEIQHGKIEAVKIGRCLMVSEEALADYIRRNTLHAKRGEA